MKPINSLKFIDDYMFGAVLQDKELCSELLEKLLKIKIEKIEYPTLQKALNIGYEKHGIRIDVYVKGDDTVYEIEMQNRHYEQIGLRSRYYQSIVDADILLKGAKYKDLPKSKVIFICTTDPFGFGIQRYTYKNICIEESAAELNDNSQKIFYNASAYQLEEDEELKAFLNFVATNRVSSKFTKKLKAQVEKIKNDEIFCKEYMSMTIWESDIEDRAIERGMKKGLEMGITQGIAQGIAQGIEETKLANAKALILLGKNTLEDISLACELPLETVQKLAEEIKQNK